MALAVGDLAFRPLGDRAGVYAEPAVVERAAWEFADIEKMIAAAEKLYGPYRWGRYDVLVLPPSFPFGGMENPRLTFATPTILAGDRSLVSLVAHELAHSWSGNLVTNATWNDFWLNEGFTVYFEHRIMEALYGRDYAEMLAALGRGDLLETIEELGATSPDTRLQARPGRPRPGRRGHRRRLREGRTSCCGASRRSWAGRPSTSSCAPTSSATPSARWTTETFLALLDRELLAKHPELSGRGAPVGLRAGPAGDGRRSPSRTPSPRSRRKPKPFGAALRRRARDAGLVRRTSGSTSSARCPTPLPADRIADLDQTFKLSDSGNSEVLAAWLEKVIASSYAPAYPALERFLTGMGRRKFLQPLYTAFAKTPAGTELALRIYEKARPGYHTVSRQTIDKILDWRG